jgi:hypothetical protein
MRLLRWLLVLAPFLPLVVFSIPQGVTFLSEPSDPWYTPYTSLLFIPCAMFVYPVTALLLIFGIQPVSPPWFLGIALYASAIAALTYRLLVRRPQTKAIKPSGPRDSTAT